MSPTPAGVHLRRVGTATVIGALVVGASLFGTRAALAFVPVPEIGLPGYLTLAAQPAQLQFSNLSPGTAGYGQVRVELADAESAMLSVHAFGSGPLFDHATGVSLITRLCDAEWADVPTGIVGSASSAPAPSCATGELAVSTLADPQLITDETPDIAVGTLTAGEPRYLLVEARLPNVADVADEAGLMGLSGDFAVRVSAAGDDPALTPPPSTPPGPTDPGTPPGGNPPGAAPSGTGNPDRNLASTGFDAIGAALCALGAITLGLLAWRHRRPATETDWPA
jgi:hypothetical protein